MAVNVCASAAMSDIINVPLVLIHHMMDVLLQHSLRTPLLVLFRSAHKKRVLIVSDGQLEMERRGRSMYTYWVGC